MSDLPWFAHQHAGCFKIYGVMVKQHFSRMDLEKAHKSASGAAELIQGLSHAHHLG